jgi:aldehyde:ferredoxin oxidoreductase
VTFAPVGGAEIAALLRTATGFDYDVDELMRAGERIWNLERMFNLRAGFSKKDDTLPKRLLREPMPGGPAEGKTVPLEEMLSEYYHLRGWDKEGRPTKERLAALGL